ncbi:lipopolysaccharide biosynthesis protein [Fusibacter sp. A1]|uniref:lipopolysaccharide biosynthesis protein n=2 Tax=Fusibacter TaxID=76008 RepID=UPI00149520D0|nr:lipopolysaccharide biosynthesis protein [Fusibacter sp. A1]
MNKGMNKDILFYLPAKLIEGLAGVLMISLYTRILTPQLYDHYILLNGTVLMCYQLIVGWLLHAGYRHINEAQTDSEKTKYISTLLTTWLGLQSIYLAVAGLIYAFVSDYRVWILYSLLWFVFYSGTQLMIAVLAANKKVMLSVSASTATLSVKVLLTWGLSQVVSPWAGIVISHITVDAVLFAVLLARSSFITFWKFSEWDYALFKKFLHYGVPLIGMALAMSVTSMSDRFVIDRFLVGGSAGIYQANYGIAAAAFSMIMIAMMRAVYPNILKHFERDRSSYPSVIWQGLRMYLLLAVPAAVGLVLLSYDISARILDLQYVVGYSVIGWVAAGMLLLGLTEYLIKPLELNKNTKPIFLASVAAASLNLILNLIYVPSGGIIVAAMTTFLSYLVYLLILAVMVKSKYEIIIKWKSVARICLASSAMAIPVLLTKNFITGWLTLIAVVSCAVLVYSAALIVTGELKNELTYLLSKFRRQD